MKLEKFKEKDKKKIGIILFTITCVLLISGVILYRTFAIFETNDTFNIINGEVKDEGNIRFMVYVGNELQKSVPNKESGYSLDTSASYCENGEIVSWNDEKWSVEIKGVSTTKTKCYLYFKEIYIDETLKQTDGSIGPIPDLGSGRLIPITISDSEKPSDVTYNGGSLGGKVRKADITTDWYNYSKQQWANAIILKDGEVDHYKPGDEILENVIESYFVWIPRYRYKLKNDENVYNGYTITEIGSVGSISEFYERYPNQATSNIFDIQFETKNDGVKAGNTKDTYITHPAFTTFNSNGFWVGKFETGYNQNDSNDNVAPNVSTWNTKGAEKNENKTEKIIIKPNVYSWRNIQVSNAFYASYEYIRELESHMMKNTEWGAIAYLTQSKYGRCPNGTCTEISINNSEYYITGMSTTHAPTCGSIGANEQCNFYGGPKELSELESGDIKGYYLTESQGGSTTGNYTGIYDMVGGSWEYVMGVMQAGANDVRPSTGCDATNNSGFIGPYSMSSGENSNGLSWPSSKYYDLYDYDTSTEQYQRGILGDATKEVGSFYKIKYQISSYSGERKIGSYNADLAYFVKSNTPWFRRGGFNSDGTDTGVFAFAEDYGSGTFCNGFRIVLSP